MNTLLAVVGILIFFSPIFIATFLFVVSRRKLTANKHGMMRVR